MSKSTDLRDDAAAIAYDIASDDAYGVDITFQNASGLATVALRGFILAGSGVPSVESEAETRKLSLEIPRQTGFPPTAGVYVGATATVNSVCYRIERLRGDLDDDPTLILECERQAEDAIAG